jgi:excisionase family DNA binding protein
MPPVVTTEFSLEETALRLGVSLATLHRWLANGTAPPSYRRGKSRRFPVDKLEAWLAAQQAAAR